MLRTVYNQKSHLLLVGSGTTTTLSHLSTKLIKVFQYILKLIETFLIQSYFYSNAKKYKQDKKTGTNIELKTDS